MKIYDMKRIFYASLLALTILLSYNKTLAQSSVIGNPIKIGNLLVAQHDFPNKMNWEDATKSCSSLGNGWRLPTKIELNILYNNLGKIGNVANDGYWTSTENGNERAWRQYLFQEGHSYDDVKYGSGYVRAVGNYGVVKVVPSNSFNSSTNNITESSDCSDIVNAYELAVRKNITALRKIRNNGYVSKDEFINLDNDIRKWQEIVMKKCAFDLKYANRVVNIMEQLELGYNSTFPSIKENSVSNTNNNSKKSSNSSSSSSNNKQSSNSIKSGENTNQPIKTTKKEVDLSYEVLSQIVSCKSCGSSVTVKMNVPRSDEFKKSFNQIGGITSSMCGKCNKTSSFTYEMKGGKFVKIN
jgi:hypothetical protein